MAGKTIKIIMSGDLYEDLEKVSKGTGIPVTFLIDDGIRKMVDPFRDYVSGRVDLRNAVFVAEEGHVEHPCIVIGEKEFFGEMYYRVWIPEHERFQSMPARLIRLV